jgi:tripartite-type tricarboxylate transporter receptor subunit TctC
MRSSKLIQYLAMAGALTFAPLAMAQSAFPSKPISVVVPFAAGGPTDTVARLIAQSMQGTLKQTVIVDNSAGAGGTIGTAKVAAAKNDGYTVLLMHIGISTAPALYRNLKYNPVTDFEPIGLITDVPMTFVAKKDFPPATFKDMIAYVKANKDKVTLANAGLGAASHLCGLLFQSAIQTELTTVPYKGTGPAMNDLLGGQVDLMCDQTTNTTGQIKAGKVKAYAVTTKTKVGALPDLPPASEAGLPNFEVAVWHGMWAPKGTPKDVIDKLNGALRIALKDPSIKSKFADLGTEPVSEARAAPAALAAHTKAEVEKWGPIIKKAGVYAD